MKSVLILTISCILFFSGIVFSKDHFITLSDEFIVSPSDDYYVSDVINVSGEDNYIGFVLAGSIQEPAVFKEGIDAEILSFLQNQFYEYGYLTQLIIRINSLFYYESILSEFGNKIKIVDLNCTFIIKDSVGYHNAFTAACSVNTKNQNQLSSRVIARSFEEAFNQFHKRMQQGLIVERQISPEELIHNHLKDSCHTRDQLNINSVRKGIFKTFYDFRDNTPDTTIYFNIRYKDKKTELSDIMLHTAKLYNGDWELFENVWGFADGKNVYCFVNNSFYLLEKSEESYYVGLVGKKNLKYTGIGAIAGAGIGGIGNGMSGSVVGLVGGILVGSLFDAASAMLIEVKLNFTTGTFDAYLLESQKKVESTLLFYASGFNKTESGIKLNLNGEYCCTLVPDTWTKVDLPSNIKKINASFMTINKDETLIEISPTLFKTDYYFCLEKKKKNRKSYKS